MRPDPHLLALGYPKCGNVWLRSLLASLLQEAGVDFRQIMASHPIAPVLEAMDLGIKDQARQDQVRFEPLRAYQDIPMVFGWAIPDLPAYVAATSMAHSHCMWKAETNHHLREFSHRILIVRDPRDVAVSWSRWIFTPFNRLHRPTLCPTPDALLEEDLPRRLMEWNVHQESWLIHRATDLSLHVVFYEQLVDDTPRELGRIAQHHAQSFVILRQTKPSSTSRHHMRVEFDRCGAHPQHLVAMFGQRACAQAKLHGVQPGQSIRVVPKQPSLHALHVFQFNVVRFLDPHRPLNPRRAQMQIPHFAVLGHVHWRKIGKRRGHGRNCRQFGVFALEACSQSSPIPSAWRTLRVVTDCTSSTDTPRNSANTCAMRGTWSGVLRPCFWP